jgi:pyruvate dehydrogenase E1 component beta subunit
VGIDQIINNAAKMRQMTGVQFNLRIVFSWQPTADRTIRVHSRQKTGLQNTPGLKVVVPSTVYD